jgi:hypothetical protein
MKPAFVAALCLGLLQLLPACQADGAAPPAQSPLEGRAVEQFVERTQAYMQLREEAAATVPALKETPSPVEIQARQKALATAVRAQRKGARRGDLFGDAAPAIRQRLLAYMQRLPEVERESLWKQIPPVEVPAVDADYPPQLPLASFPPTLLTELPELPEELEYRFAGSHLILLDAEANLILDVLPDAVQKPPATPGDPAPRLGEEAGQ